MEQRETNI